MNWQAISFDWNQARAFLAVLETGSLSSAARVLKQTQPTIGRQITALEDQLGVALFERAGRSLQVTQTGQDIADHVRAMADAASRMSMVASGQSQAIEGDVRITVSDIFGAHILPPVLDRLREIAPKIRIDVVATNDISDILRRDADIAIRNVRPTEPELIARLVHDAKAHFYASRSYLDRRGRPQTKDDLQHHDFVSFGDIDQTIAYVKDMGIHLTPENFRVSSANGLVAWEMVRRGFGISPMSVDVANQSSEVERILEHIDPINFPVWLTTHRELHTSKRMRLVFDTLADHLPKLLT
jgi:DNA-binding transcriptional LysR family regulator